MKKKIAILTSCEGHLSIAQSVQETLSLDYTIGRFEEIDFLFHFYRPIYRFFPSAIKIPFKLAEHRFAVRKITAMFDRKYEEKLRNFVNEFKPHLLVNTYFMYNPTLEKISKELNIPYINILTDPRSMHPVVISPEATVNFAFDNALVHRSESFFPDAHYQISGWFVRKDFQNADKIAIRKKLKLATDKLTFLVVSGSDGNTLVMKILPALAITKEPVQIIVACGNNKLLYKSMISLSKFFKNLKSDIQLIPLLFRSDIHFFMQAADLVIGKAGPNMLFESVATHTPFFAITHISGQEDGNLDIIKDYKIGYVEENPIRATKLLQKIIQHPKELEKFKPGLEKLAKHNAQSKEILLKKVQELLHE